MELTCCHVTNIIMGAVIGVRKDSVLKHERRQVNKKSCGLKKSVGYGCGYRVWEGIMRYETVDQNHIRTNLLSFKLWYKNDIVRKRNPTVATTWLITRGVSSVAEIMWLKKHDIENYNLLVHKACSLSSRDAW